MKRIELPIYGISVQLFDDGSATIITDLKDKVNTTVDTLYNAAVDGVESFILACASSGIDIESPQFIEAIETSVQAISDNFPQE